MSFLTANWENLILVNYKVSPTILLPFLPKYTKLDDYLGEYYISLVAFMFTNTRILGFPIPFHINFEEVNLRFYVRPDYDKSKRAVVFLKEFVPRKSIELIANTLFKEHYLTSKMKHEFNKNFYSYSWSHKNDWSKVSVQLQEPLKLPKNGSVEEFITEHYWGYTKSGELTKEYEVWHPQWETCSVASYKIDVNFGKIYGEEFDFLTSEKPVNVCFAKGSPIKVFWAKNLIPYSL